MKQQPATLFDRAKPFYPWVMQFLTLLIGHKELTALGVAAIAKPVLAKRKADLEQALGRELSAAQFDDLVKSISKQVGASKGGPIDRIVLRDVSEMMPPLSLKSHSGLAPLAIDAGSVGAELASNHAYLSDSLPRAATSLLILAYESTRKFHDKGPLWEFLRHCRNAAAHNGMFRFLRNEPTRMAQWRQSVITRSLEGTPLFLSRSAAGVLAPGDAVYLLWDIEQAYPSMRA